MSLLSKSTTALIALSLVILCALPGFLTLSRTSPQGIGLQLGNGLSQRLYEARFDKAFPLRKEAQAAWAALRLSLFREVADGAVLGHNGWLFTAEEFVEPTLEIDPIGALQHAQSTLAAADIALLVLLVPDKARIMADKLPVTRSRLFEARYETSLQTLADLNIQTLDLRPTFSGFSDTTPAFMRSDTHWSPQGAAAVAQTTANAAQGTVASQSQFETLATGVTAFEGDLFSFAETGRWKPIVGPVAETIKTYESHSASAENFGLLDDISTPIALVGTSFSARPDFHFEGFLKSAFQADVVNHSQIGRGPFAPMEQFLTTLTTHSSVPDLVIWEIPERYLPTGAHQ